jgi:hypothetical protein
MNHHISQRSLRAALPNRRRRFSMMLQLALVIALLAGVPAAFAGKGGNGNGNGAKSDIWIMGSSLRAAEADGYLHHGDSVAFGFTTNYWDDVRNTGPWLRLECYDGGTLVYWENRAGFEGGYRYGVPFALGPSLAWPSGEADCVGILGHQHPKNGKFMTEATTEFHVMP